MSNKEQYISTNKISAIITPQEDNVTLKGEAKSSISTLGAIIGAKK